MANVAPIFVALTPNLFHHNNVGATSARTSNFKMELVKFVPLFYGNAPFNGYSHSSSIFNNTTHVGMRSKSQTPRAINLMNMHTEIPRKVDDFCWIAIKSRRRKFKTIRTVKTSKTFRIFWITNGESR
jgi:hypothetical protein